jgi:magnesium transporter
MENVDENIVVKASDRPWEKLLQLAKAGDHAALEQFVDELPVTVRAHTLARLAPDDLTVVVELLTPNQAAELISHLSEAQAAQAISDLQPATAAAIVHELPSDEQADLLGDLRFEKAEAILDILPENEASAVRELTAYADDVAGGLMVREFLKFDHQATIADVIRQLAEQSSYSHDVRYGYVCDQAGRLIGVLPMRDLLFHSRSTFIADLIVANPISVLDTTPLDDLIEFFHEHNFLGVPVVDKRGVLKGIVQREAVDYETARAAETDYLKSQGIVGGEELRTMPIWLRAKRRLSWLSANIVLNVGAAGVIAWYQDTLKSVIALAVFLPIISDMSGCSGNQAVAVSMRELSLGLVRTSEVFRVWTKEVVVGLINGAVLGFLVALVAIAMHGNAYLGLVVGFALFVNTLIAVSVGGTLPLVLKRFGFDPAVASGPLLTTVTDMCGFFLVLGMASLLLSRLV